MVLTTVLLLGALLRTTFGQEGLGLHFTQQPRSVVAPPGDEVVFTCTINLHADHLTWLHDWRPVEPGSNPAVDVQPGRLLVRVGRDPDTFRRQTGEYRCLAWIAPIALTSLPGRLSIARLGEFEPRQNSTLVAPPGGTVSIACPPPASQPPATVQFFRDGRAIFNRGDTVAVLPGGRLHLSDVSAALAGTYTCAASNHLTGEVVTAPFSTRLEVRTPPALFPPRLVVPPEPMYHATPNSTLRIECVAEGWPRPVVGWKRLDGRWSSARYIQHAASLELRRLRAADQGDYVCEVASPQGSLSAATVLRLTEPPSVSTTASDVSVEEGSSVELRCTGAGWPPPQLLWVLHGRPVLGGSQPQVRGGVLVFDSVGRQDAGLYQCFGHSDQGDAEAAVLLKVIPRQTDDSGSVAPPIPSAAAPQRPLPNGGRRRGGGSRRNRNRNRDGGASGGGRRQGALMVAPSAPRVYPISETSVMLQWDVPANDGLAITFFKIQYRRAPRRRHVWQTHDADVPGAARSFEVDGLEVGAKYKFRVLAVYANQDNKHGPNSRQVKMTRMRKKSKPPGAPVLTSHAPQSATAIRFNWSYRNPTAAPIEGYFIFYRDTTTAGDYSKVTVLGETTQAHILTSLLPGTAYDIKLQAFNLQGGVSDFSPIVTERTLNSPDATNTVAKPGDQSGEGLVPIVTTRGADRSRQKLYAIVGGSLGVLLLLAVIFAAIYHRRARASRKQDQDKFGDTSQQMHVQHQHHQSPYPGLDVLDPIGVDDLGLSGSTSHQELLHRTGDTPATDLTSPQLPQLGGESPPPPPVPAKARELSMGAIPVAIPTPPCCPSTVASRSSTDSRSSGAAAPLPASSAADYLSQHAAAAAALNNNKYGGDGEAAAGVERRRRIRRRDSIETQRHRLSAGR